MLNRRLLGFSLLLSLLILLGCGSQKIANYKAESVSVDSTAGKGGLESMIKPYREDMEAEMDVVIGKASVTLEKRPLESSLSNFAADAAFEAGLKYGNKSKDIGADDMKNAFCLLNFGGLRAPINRGDVTIGDVYELMPFDNTLVLVKISADKMKDLTDYLYQNLGQPVANARFKLSETLREVKIGGEDYNYDEDVVVITSNYLADGGDNMEFLTAPIIKWDSGILLRDIFIDYIKDKKELGAYSPEGRIQISNN